MTQVKVTISRDEPDRVEIDGKHLPHADFRYQDDDAGVRCVVITSRDGAETTVRSFPVASAVFEGETSEAPKENK